MKHKKYLESIYEDIKADKVSKEGFLTAIQNWINEEVEFGGTKVIEEAEEEKKNLPGQEKLF